MRGSDEGAGALFSYAEVELRIRRDHPLRQIREIANAALMALDEDFEELTRVGLGGPRFRRSGYFGPCCCRHSTGFARSSS